MALFCRKEGGSDLIPVAPQKEPASFAMQVRNPGRAFLRHTPKPTNVDFDRNAYWSRCMSDLRVAYGEICAYLSCWIPTQASLDHFLPKSTYPVQAYEWSNYRLAHEKINNRKAKSTGVLDPFAIKAGWFVLDFASFFVNPNVNLPTPVTDSIKHTINTLRLNEDQFVKLRYGVVKDYSNGDTTIGFLQRRYPFIAVELERQNLITAIIGTIA